MDVSILQAATDDFAAYLSEVTHGDLGQQTRAGDAQLGAWVLERIVRLTGTVSVLRSYQGEYQDEIVHVPSFQDVLSAPTADLGLATVYREAARAMLLAFEATDASGSTSLTRASSQSLYDEQLSLTVLDTSELADSIGLPYTPLTEIVVSALHAMGVAPLAPDSGAWACRHDEAVLLEVLRLLHGRGATHRRPSP